MVVDIKRCIEERIVIWCTTKEQANQIWNDFHEYKKIKPPLVYWNVYSKHGFEVSVCTHRGPEWQYGFNRKYFINEYKANKCLDYEEVLINKTIIYELW